MNPVEQTPRHVNEYACAWLSEISVIKSYLLFAYSTFYGAKISTKCAMIIIKVIIIAKGHRGGYAGAFNET